MSYAAIYPLISLFIFFLFFVLLLWMVKKMDKDRITELSNIPLSGNDNPTTEVSSV